MQKLRLSVFNLKRTHLDILQDVLPLLIVCTLSANRTNPFQTFTPNFPRVSKSTRLYTGLYTTGGGCMDTGLTLLPRKSTKDSIYTNYRWM